MICTEHTAPVFGCKACIEHDRESFDCIAFNAWRETYKPPSCPSCFGVMCVEDFAWRHGKLMAEVACQRDECGDGLEVEIR